MLTLVTPDYGPDVGGNQVVLFGAELATTTNVTIGGVPAPIVAVTPTYVTVVAPTGPVGPADVTITTAGGSVTRSDGYTYIGA